MIGQPPRKEGPVGIAGNGVLRCLVEAELLVVPRADPFPGYLTVPIDFQNGVVNEDVGADLRFGEGLVAEDQRFAPIGQ